MKGGMNTLHLKQNMMDNISNTRYQNESYISYIQKDNMTTIFIFDNRTGLNKMIRICHYVSQGTQ